jgi:DNA-directed RNA polymerase subunit beta'|uniref:DNA-directed RNA polymerase subunit beta' n=1 Tax=Didymosphenia geminata TaxID=1115533 RepID=A0A023HAP5_9STRA|nr:RNA polymerase b'-subunit [Didymosphenia geminata]AGH28741.1 RNA polymerase b'-subunit [Didymosphenia geminata]
MGKSTKEFDYIKIKLASPFRILQWANRKLPNGQFVGEVQKSETINYRTFKPEMDGLFCERIFGPSKSFECACGKYKRVRYEGLICERCGVELTESRVRRHRMGYINLIYPVTHVWYINSRPNFMALLLEVEECEKKLDTTYTAHSERCKKCEGLKLTTSTIVDLWDERIKRIKLASLAYFIAEDEISFYGLHWDLQQYRRSRELGYSGYPLKPYPKPQNRRYNTPKYLLRATPNFLIGAPLIKRELEKLNLKSEIFRMRCFILVCTKVLNKENPIYAESKWFRKWEQQRIYKIREQVIKRIRILENLVGTGSNPAWMILTILPVIPPALRPMIQLEGGRFATSDLNELYRRIITRNNRLLRLLEIDAPQLIIRNEKRLLQEAVDTLIDNGKRGKIALSANNRPLKSLSDIIKGKHGRFRQNLLGKRVDYSGRSVIVVGPSLKLNQCGLPYEMAIELFQPFIIRELINQGLASNMKIAKNLIQHNESIIDPVLEKVLKNHPIFLNRAPTLHRLGIQAFEPILVQGRAIKLHPLVCSAFNADFDGDQMAVHIPLSLEAQAECYMLMLAPYNFLSPANGEPIIMPSQDMVLGCYYLTVNNIKGLLGSNHYFANLDDVILAYSQNEIELHSEIWIRIQEENASFLSTLIKTVTLNDGSIIEYYENNQIRKTKTGEIIVRYIRTTTGRAILNYILQKTLNFL